MNRSEAGRLGGYLGGARGGKARMEKLTPQQRSELAARAAAARWGERPEVHQVVRMMLDRIERERVTLVLYVRGKDAWFAPPGHLEHERWLPYCVGTYSPDGTPTFTQVMEDVLA